MKVLRGAEALPLKKGDIVIIRHTYMMLGEGIKKYFTAERVGRGGKSPRYENGSPIYLTDVEAVIRPGWELKRPIRRNSVIGVIRKALEEMK